MASIVTWTKLREQQQVINLATKEARANFNKDLAFRKWATEHGGIYVNPDERTPPNPYLAHLPKRDVTTNGDMLTLMNPAYMMRQLTTEFEEIYNIKGNITALILTNPINAPDPWEKEVLEKFKASDTKRIIKEAIKITDIDHVPHLRLMKPMYMTKGCVKCHGHLGFKDGDLRGGISVSIPLTAYYQDADRVTRNMALVVVALWVFGIIMIVRHVKYLHKQNLMEERLRRAHDTLEQRVTNRTAELSKTLAQLESTQAQLVNAAKLASIGTMTTGIAHELNSPLQVISLTLEEIQEALDDDDIDKSTILSDTHSVMGNVKRLTNVISSLKNLSHNGEKTDYQRINPAESCEKILTAMSAIFQKSHISIKKHYADNLPEIDADNHLLEQALKSLFDNATTALAETKQPTIELTVDQQNEEIIIRITDNGSGIPEKNIEHIFDPFFTTKEIGEGTGLGLSIAHHIITDHHGTLKVSSTVDGGTTFTITLPIPADN
ncbi:MAG: DUF3365 domain-containing protein [Candidatus Polarisedimenticolaceae bacterium]|nr:DUF3365 domain-containing protein [Candidatus Polarisedimenticolaceae bacterium]